MEKENSMQNKNGNNSEYRNLTTNTFYSFLINYGSHFFTFIYSFLLARLISDISWGFLITATSIMTIIVIISSLLPPGLNYALNYYIPRYLALNQKSNIKSLIKNSIKIKLLFLIPVFIISIISFYIFASLFAINLEDKVHLLYYLSPIIFVNSFSFILNSINRGFNRFNFIFLLLLIKNAIHIIPLLIYYIFDFSKISIEIVALIVTISTVIPFVINVIYILIIIIKIKPLEEKKESFKEDIQKTFNYGKYIGSSNMIDRIWKEAQLQGIGIFISKEAVTGYNIGWNYKDIAAYSAYSLYYPLMSSFTSLDTKKNYDQIDLIYRIAYKITLFLILIISGVLFFSVAFFLDFAFLESRLIYSNFLRLMVIASIFVVLNYFIETLLNAKNKVKNSLLLKLSYMLYYFPLFFVGLIYFGVEGAIILGSIIGNIISVIIQIIATSKLGNIKLNFKKILIQYLTFFIPLGITYILEILVFKQISFNIIQALGLILFKNFDFLSIGTFLLLFFSMNFFLKTVTSTDINNFENLLDKNKKMDKILIKILNFIKIFTRK